MKDKCINIFLIILIFILTIFIVLFSINYLNIDKSIIKSSKEQKQSSNSLALMYETAPETGEYNVSTDSVWPSSDFTINSTLSKCENGSTLTYDIITKKVKVQSNKSDKCYVYFDKIQTIGNKCKNQNLASCMKTNYELDNNINFHNSTLANGANDGSYRFSGANPNNYVCFGPGATAAGQTCPDNNLYRIIGIFGDQVKLKDSRNKATYIVWDNKGTNGDNTWSTSLINDYLNGEYLNMDITPTWSNKISSNTWQVGGMSYDNGLAVPATVYNYEVGLNKANVIFNGKIGLMYVSDYGFAAQPLAWTLKLGGHNDNVNDYSNPIAKSNNWLFNAFNEWAMSRYSTSSYHAFGFCKDGYVRYDGVTYGLVAHPVFYLQSSTNLTGGMGTKQDPYRIL